MTNTTTGIQTTPHHHAPVVRGRGGGDYDLSRLLRRTRWGAGGGSNSLAQGCSVRDMVAAMEDPLQRGSCFRNVSSDILFCYCLAFLRKRDGFTRRAFFPCVTAVHGTGNRFLVLGAKMLW